MSFEKEISILGGRVKLRQIEGGFHTGLDAVMLAAACPARSGQRVLDLGCGVGGAGICVLSRVDDSLLSGVDIQSDHIDFALENSKINKFSKRTEFFCDDVRNFRNRAFDHVICNPPYMEAGTYLRSPSEKRATALGHEEEGAVLEDWVICAFDCLVGRGSFTMIHRADTLDKIIQAFGKRFGAIEIIPLWPKAGKEAGRVIVRGVKHAKGPAKIHAGLILHQEDGAYTPQADAVLRDAQGLFL